VHKEIHYSGAPSKNHTISPRELLLGRNDNLAIQKRILNFTHELKCFETTDSLEKKQVFAWNSKNERFHLILNPKYFRSFVCDFPFFPSFF